MVCAILDCVHIGITRRLCARVQKDSRGSRVVLGCGSGGAARTWRTRTGKHPKASMVTSFRGKQVITNYVE